MDTYNVSLVYSKDYTLSQCIIESGEFKFKYDVTNRVEAEQLISKTIDDLKEYRRVFNQVYSKKPRGRRKK